MESDHQLKTVSPPLLPLKANPSLFVPFNNNKKAKNILKFFKNIYKGSEGYSKAFLAKGGHVHRSPYPPTACPKTNPLSHFPPPLDYFP